MFDTNTSNINIDADVDTAFSGGSVTSGTDSDDVIVATLDTPSSGDIVDGDFDFIA